MMILRTLRVKVLVVTIIRRIAKIILVIILVSLQSWDYSSKLEVVYSRGYIGNGKENGNCSSTLG